VGQGGIGKTRLSLALGAAVLEQFAEGVCFVPLATVQTPAVDSDEVMATVLATAVAHALNFTFSGSSSSVEQLLAYLRHKEMLLILDNFEHLMAGAGFVELLLQQSPQLTILVTSRESLNLHAEYAVQLAGLPVPEAVSEAAHNASVRLFVERANRTRSDFQLNAENLPAIVTICQLVDGNPLALELAAAWIRLMSGNEIAQAIQQNIDFLTTSLRQIPERHRSMRAVFASSWALLTPNEQQALAQLSIFQGGAKREGITAVIAADLLLLAGLVDKSLLHWRTSGRYELHELVRQFAAEKLAERPSAELADIWGRYGRYYLNFVCQRADALSSESARQALAELRAEANNIRCAWEWVVNQQDEAALADGLPGLARFYLLTGQNQAGVEAMALALKKVTANDGLRARLLVQQAAFLNGQGGYEAAIGSCETAVALAPTQPEMTAKAHLYWGEALWYKGNLEAAQAQLRQALALAQQTGLRSIETHCLLMIGSVYLRQGENTEAQAYYEQALQLAQRLGDSLQESQAVRNLGGVSRNLGRYAQAQSYYEQGLRLARHIGDRQGEGAAHNNLGDLLLYQGIYTEAKSHFEQGLTVARLIGNRRGETIGLNNLGIVARDVGLYQEAQAYYEQSLRLSQEIGYTRGKGWTLICQALLLAQTGDFSAARQHGFEALYLFETMQDKLGIGFASLSYGKALEGLHYWQEAAQAYAKAVDIRGEMGQHHLLPESWAGLANVALQLEDETEALAQVEKILAFVADAPYLDGVYEPMRVYMICMQVLERVGDGRYETVRETAVQILQKRAAQIRDDPMRHSFLQNVPIHQQLLQM
jgi:predicted ATPase/Tfp pilus assembly protein PilF